MHTYVFFLVMALTPQGDRLYTGERFANPIDCQVRANEINAKKPKFMRFCMEYRSPIDLSKPLTEKSK